MSFTDGKPFDVTEEMLSLPWSGARDGRNFRCSICGDFFHVGQRAVFVYGADGVPNFFACAERHGTKEEMRVEMVRLQRLVEDRYWWALPHHERPPRPGTRRDSRADRQD